MTILEYKLDESAIDEIAEKVQGFLNGLNMERRNVLRVRLSVEEVLLKWLEKFRGTQCSLSIGKRLGSPFVSICVKGEECNPLEEANQEYGEWSSHLLENMGLSPVFSYQKGQNQIVLKLKKKKKKPMIAILEALVFAVLLGILGRFLPDGIRLTISDGILAPIFNVFLGVLNTIAGPMIFLSVAWGIYSIGDVATLGSIGKNMMLRFAGKSFLIAGLGALIMVPFFQINMQFGAIDASQISNIYQMLLNIFPTNIVKPFYDGNAMQIIVIAIAFGLAMLVLGNQATVAAKFVEQANYIVQFLMEIISAVVPFFIFISLLQMILSDSLSVILPTWKALVLFIAATVILLAGNIFIVCMKEKVKFTAMVRKLFPTFLIALTTASSSASFGSNVQCCEKKLGIHSKITNFGIPLGIVIYMPATAINFLVVGLYMAESYQVDITWSWILMAVLITGVLSIATPPIPGGALACYTILFLQLGIPEEALILTMTLDIIFDCISTAASQTFLQLELLVQADRLRLLDKIVLQGE